MRKRSVKFEKAPKSDGLKRDNSAGTDVTVRVSPVMLVMATVFVAFGMVYEFACSLTAVILHEFAHARVAKKLGYVLNEIKIMPYGAALCGTCDMRPRDEAIIAAAGPTFNLVLGMVFAAMWWLIPSSYLFTQTFCVCNIYIGLFNLLPVYPMDGGRILFAALSGKLKRKCAYKICRIVSAVIGAAAIALFVVSAVYAPNICFLNVGIFMVASAFIPDARARYYALFAFGSRKKRIEMPFETRIYAVSSASPLAALCRALDPDKYNVFDVYDDEFKSVGRVGETELVELVQNYGYSVTIGEACSKYKNAKGLDF